VTFGPSSSLMLCARQRSCGGFDHALPRRRGDVGFGEKPFSRDNAVSARLDPGDKNPRARRSIRISQCPISALAEAAFRWHLQRRSANM